MGTSEKDTVISTTTIKTMDKLEEKTYYKYRNLTDFERFLDVVVNNRLYGAVYKELNDPMEGRFNTTGLDKKDFEDIYKRLKTTRICSMLTKQDSQTFPDDYLMWSHYADSHKGCCLELQPTKQYNDGWQLIEVKYQDNLPIIDTFNLDDGIHKILSVKTPIWKTEHEVRAVKQYDENRFSTQSEYYHVKIVAVYFGERVSKAKCDFYKKFISKINAAIKLNRIREDKSNPGFFPTLVAELI